ncbi:MAG: DUF4956 domain-containing protein [Caldilineales bacterium]|nr:DUF4956 domain-containing protein [Caldilineales bacterium]
MDIINQFFTSVVDATNTFTIQDVALTIVLSFALSMIIAWTYRRTHRSASYSQSFVHTLVLVSMVVAVIMLVVGSNIARAFTLVGALSIVRFRNAVKETRDVGFIFFAMGIGMACGVGFYGLAVVATLVISGLNWAMVTFNTFAKDIREQILKIRVPVDIPYDNLFNAVFNRYLNRYDLIAVETTQAGTLNELVYGVELKKSSEAQAMINELRQLNDNNKVALITGQQEVDL